MTGLDALHPLLGGKEWGPPAALPTAVAALKRLRERWLGGAGKGSERGLRPRKHAEGDFYLQPLRSR